mmetsp:Transcript_21900/g.52321  ORF Transcript_21900/g.52321 Transcript_21900/m.52321 type:complete len:200 (+) Transcript_21900:986-1585(+)
MRPALQSRLSMVSASSIGVLNSPSKRPSTTRAGISTCSMNMSESSKLAMLINCRWLSASPSVEMGSSMMLSSKYLVRYTSSFTRTAAISAWKKSTYTQYSTNWTASVLTTVLIFPRILFTGAIAFSNAVGGFLGRLWSLCRARSALHPGGLLTGLSSASYCLGVAAEAPFKAAGGSPSAFVRLIAGSEQPVGRTIFGAS